MLIHRRIWGFWTTVKGRRTYLINRPFGAIQGDSSVKTRQKAVLTRADAISYHRLVASTVLAVCAALIALGLWVGLAFLAYTLIQVRRAAMAVEALAYTLEDSASNLRNVSLLLSRLTDTARSGWLRTARTAVGALAALWPGRGRPGNDA